MGRPAAGAPRRNGEDVLLKTEMSAGHGGVSGRYNAWRDRAFSYAWVLDRVGLGLTASTSVAAEQSRSA